MALSRWLIKIRTSIKPGNLTFCKALLSDQIETTSVNQWLNNLCVDLVANVALTLKRNHVRETGPLGDVDRRCEVIAVAVFVADVFDEQQKT